MAPSDKVIRSFLYVPDKRVVLVLEDAKDALEASKSIKGAEIYANNQYVFLPTPHGLELVRGAKHGETAYVFHYAHDAEDWFKTLKGFGVMYPDGEAPRRTVFLGRDGQEHGGEPVWPGVF